MLVNPLPYMDDLKQPLSDVPLRDALPWRECRTLVDADMFVYAAGFAVEHHEPIAYGEGGKLLFHGKGKAEYNKWCKEHPHLAAQVVDLDYLDWVEDFDKCEMILKQKRLLIKNTTRNSPQSWYLTKGSTLWRNEDATIQAYKGNRKEMEKPVYYDECRQFMIDRFIAKVCQGMEADDSVAQTARDNEGSVIVASGDKDLRTVPGYQLNIGNIKEGVEYVTPLQACRNLYIQMLMGDRIDNIKGLSGTKGKPGYGIKTATKAIEQYITEYDMAKFVAKEYKSKYPDGVMSEDGTTHLAWQDMLVETANLLFLRRYQDVRFKWED